MNGWVEGIIKDNNGNPVGGVDVTINNTSGSYTTGSNGYYIKLLPPCATRRQGCSGYTVNARKNNLRGVANGVHIRSGAGIAKNITIS
ncbi:MAG: carboxypeptidase regulatory-like domain-containing protein [Candidatus Brocadia sp.]|nr:hypothetical protein [Candidatus Brocadia sp.]MDG6025187.1 carboxypeptidase regulatory-like domain-containing protein [Candidatus Brocadia sp.]